MKHIDFMPPEMLRRNEVRALRWWWIGVCIAFGLFIATAATMQWIRSREVKHQIARIQPLCDSAKAQEKLIAELNSQLQQETEIANLYAFLDHPWPRSRILADLLTALPNEVQITELKLAPQQLLDSRTRTVAETQVIVNPQEQVELPAAIEDFKALWQRASTMRTVVELKGITRDALRLHQYVGDLADGSLVESAKLESFEEVADQQQTRMQFTVRVVIRSAYSLPGGPSDSVPNEQAMAAVGDNP